MDTPSTDEPAPAAIRVDCGHFHPIGICPKCKRPHDYAITLPPPPLKTEH